MYVYVYVYVGSTIIGANISVETTADRSVHDAVKRTKACKMQSEKKLLVNSDSL